MRVWSRPLTKTGTSGTDHAGQLVVYAHDHTHDLPCSCAQRRTGGSADSGSADLGPARPTRAVKNVGEEGAVIRRADTVHSADKPARSLRCAAGVCTHVSAQATSVAAPVVHRPSHSVETGSENPKALGTLHKASNIPVRVHGCAIRLAASNSDDVEEALPGTSGITIDQSRATSSKHHANHATVVIGRAAGSRSGGGCKVGECFPGCTVVERP